MNKALLIFSLLVGSISQAYTVKQASTESHKSLVTSLEGAFKKPVFIGKKFSSKDFSLSKAKKGDAFDQQNYLSNYLKLKGIGIAETDRAVSLVYSGDLVKMKTLVFRNELPVKLRE